MFVRLNGGEKRDFFSVHFTLRTFYCYFATPFTHKKNYERRECGMSNIHIIKRRERISIFYVFIINLILVFIIWSILFLYVASTWMMLKDMNKMIIATMCTVRWNRRGGWSNIEVRLRLWGFLECTKSVTQAILNLIATSVSPAFPHVKN